MAQFLNFHYFPLVGNFEITNTKCLALKNMVCETNVIIQLLSTQRLSQCQRMIRFLQINPCLLDHFQRRCKNLSALNSNKSLCCLFMVRCQNMQITNQIPGYNHTDGLMMRMFISYFMYINIITLRNEKYHHSNCGLVSLFKIGPQSIFSQLIIHLKPIYMDMGDVYRNR